jgi:cytochrome P450
VERLRPHIERIAGELLSALAPAGAADLVASFAAPLPIMVMCELLGIPVEDRANLRRWNIAMLTGGADAPDAMGNIVRLMVTLIRRKRVEPEDDLLSALVATRDQDDRLSEDELTSLAFLILVAGYDDPTNLIGNATLALCRNPEQRDALRADPGLIGPAVEELFRYDTSAAVAPRRFPIEDMEIGGVTIRAGEPVMLVLSSANRDPAQFPDADTLALHRNPKHLSFGHGIHHCLGASLGRLEVAIAIRAVVRELPGLRLAVPETELTWLPSFRFRSLSRLPATWNVGGEQL